MIHRNTRCSVVLFGAALAACGGDIAAATQPPVVALRVHPTGNFAINIGETVLFTAAFLAADSSERGPATSVVWSSSDTTVGVITADGHFHARCTGNAVIRASVTEDAKTLTGTRLVPVNTTGPHCAISDLFDRTPNER